MRMQDKADGDSHEKSMGEFSDEHVQQPQDDRKAVQRRTFTRWMNALLQRCDPPVEVHDLFTDIQDGRILMALLEELSGCKLLYRYRSSSHRIFRLNNISKALAFLDDRHVKLLGIDASGIADGVPAVVLNLVWNIILHFQVKEVTGGLQRRLSSSLSSLSMNSHPSSSDLSPEPRDFSSHSCSPTPSKGRRATRKPKYHGKALKTLLQWVQGCTLNFGVEVLDFGKSWRSGLAFLAMIKSVNPSLVDLRESLTREPRENIQLAFNTAHYSLDIPPLLELEDVLCSSPDEKSIITYVSMFLVHCSDIEENNASDVEVPAIPHFGSLESVTFGEINADEPEAKALLIGFEKSTEQQLWKQWARRHLLHTNGAVTPDLSSSCGDIFSTCHSQSTTEQPAGSPETSAFTKKRSKYRSVFKPPSPLDAGVVSLEIRSWMDEASGGQGYSKQKAGESRFSLSSEEGVYNLSALDSDEEEAYSYILELNEEDFQPNDQLTRKVPRVEEETAEEMFLNGQLSEESKPLEVHENPKANGYKDQEVLLKQNVELDKSEAQRECDWDKNDRCSKEIANNGSVLAMQSEKDRKCRKGKKEDRVVGQSDGRGEYCGEDRRKEKSDSAYLMTHGCTKTEVLNDEIKETNLSEVEKATERGLYERCGQVGEKRFGKEEKDKEKYTIFEERKYRKERREKEGNNVKDQEKGNQPTVFNEEGFKVNENTLVDQPEVKGAAATRINTEEDNGSKETPTVEDLTSQDENKKEYRDKVKHLIDAEEVLTKEEKDMELQVKRRTLSVKKATIMDHRGKTPPQNDTNGGVTVHNDDKGWTPADSATSQSFRGAGSTLRSLAASCGTTPLELEMLLVLWILLYCCFILPQINL
ncbi:uncharacterized protein clmnb [Labrus bergylta]|uniref:uncharacterized protein clmnb n=1 Tax=Labrus bergylta TaxID=56723 RepID=UPI003313E1CD